MDMILSMYSLYPMETRTREQLFRRKYNMDGFQSSPFYRDAKLEKFLITDIFCHMSNGQCNFI
jgi:hypothetical protein